MTPCGRRVYWWGDGLETRCQLPIGHVGDHCDGLYWYTDDGFRVPQPEPRSTGWQHDHTACRSRAQHGTTAGHSHHQQHGERFCPPCWDAVAEYIASRRAS